MMNVDADAFDAFEAKGWENRARGYAERLLGVTAHTVEPLLDAARVGPGTRVLDVATGPGHVAAACAARGAAPVGLDVAHEMISVARARHPELDFRQGDAQRLIFADATLDAVVGNFAILHFGRPQQAVAEFVRVLKPGGSVALSTWDTPDRTRMLGVFLEAADEVGAVPMTHVPAGPPFFRFADDAEFTRLLRDAGLGEISVQTFAYRHRFSSPNDLWDTIGSSTVRMRALVFEQPAQVLAAIRSAFDRRVAEYTTDDGGLDMWISVKVGAGFRERTSTA